MPARTSPTVFGVDLNVGYAAACCAIFIAAPPVRVIADYAVQRCAAHALDQWVGLVVRKFLHMLVHFILTGEEAIE